MTTTDLSAKTGISPSTLKLWVREGWLRPAATGYGKGDSHYFSDDNVAQARAIAEIRNIFGDGRAARQILSEAIPQVRRGTPSIHIPACELVLT